MSKTQRSRLAAMLSGEGIEIGALHLPLPVPAAAHVTYVDRLSVAQQRQHYEELSRLDLTPVDVLASAEDLSAFTDGTLDFVIANHLIEHLEDPVRALKEFDRVLRPRGLLFVCVPDARVTFDRLRPLTSADHLLAEHRAGAPAIAGNRRAHYADWVANVERSGVLGDLHRPASASTEDELVERLMAMDYSIHFHCWHASTFLDLLDRVQREEGIGLEVLDAVDTTGDGSDELIVLAGKRPSLAQRMRARVDPATAWTRNLKELVRVTPAGPPLTAAVRRLRAVAGRR